MRESESKDYEFTVRIDPITFFFLLLVRVLLPRLLLLVKKIFDFSRILGRLFVSRIIKKKTFSFYLLTFDRTTDDEVATCTNFPVNNDLRNVKRRT